MSSRSSMTEKEVGDAIWDESARLKNFLSCFNGENDCLESRVVGEESAARSVGARYGSMTPVKLVGVTDGLGGA